MRSVFEDSGRRWEVEQDAAAAQAAASKRLRCTSRQRVVFIDAPATWEKMDSSDLVDLISREVDRSAADGTR
jgi:hypothetical protein